MSRNFGAWLFPRPFSLLIDKITALAMLRIMCLNNAQIVHID